MNVRVYYANAEYEPGKHTILAVFVPNIHLTLPEDDPDTTPNIPYTVIEIDQKYNRILANKIAHWRQAIPNKGALSLVDLYYVDNLGQIRDLKGGVLIPVQNTEKADWAASVLAKATNAQIDNYFANNVTTLAQARTTMTMMAKLIVRLAKEIGME